MTDVVVMEETRALASQKRKAWAKSRDSWQASEEVSAEAATDTVRVEGGEEAENIPIEKIAIWLKDCRTPLGASLDEQNNPTFLQKGMLLKNGGSFEDDLSLGADANHLHQRSLSMDPTFNGIFAKDRRLLFHQKGRSMNSTGSGKSSATVSSVSELLDLYEEDPEEILYNLGFGKDEPDIASKIPARFFNGCSLAHGIDIKLFLNAQMQRLEVENPNFALTSRFRQIQVLTDVANAFSSLYSQVSGKPPEKIGNSKNAEADQENEPSKPLPPPLLKRSSSRLMEKITKLNLSGIRAAAENKTPAASLDNDTGQVTNGKQEESIKGDQKTQKMFKKNSQPLATVNEETSNSAIILDLKPVNDAPTLTTEKSTVGLDEVMTEPCTSKPDIILVNQNDCDISHITDSSATKNPSVIMDQESESFLIEENPHTSTPEKELCAPNPSILNLINQPKDSFELEELQSTEDELTHGTPFHSSEKFSKDNLLRTASQHSDSSGFAEDTSADCLTACAQGQESLQAMGSSADSCDSETTVTSVGEDLRTPLATDHPLSTDFDIDDEFLTPCYTTENKVFFVEKQTNVEKSKSDTEQISPSEEYRSQQDHSSGLKSNSDNIEESDMPQEYSVESEIVTESEYETVPYTTHHISERIDCSEDNFSRSENSSSSSLDHVNVALQRAQMRIFSSSGVTDRTGRSLMSSKDLLKKTHRLSNTGYPLRRTQSFDSALLSPVRVVSKVNIVLTSGKATVCSPPSFSYKYTPGEEEFIEQAEEDSNTFSKPLHVTPKADLKEVPRNSLNKIMEDTNQKPQFFTTSAPSHRSQSSCSLHSLLSDWHEKPFCDHGRAWSTHSVPNFSGASCGAFISPYSCPLSARTVCGSLHRSCSGCTLPVNSPPSTTEMQLRRVLHEIRNSLQNLSQNTFQELQIMRRSLNLFRTQMMDLELSMLRQQSMVYQHLTEEERYEADQLQGLRNSVRMELQELELQLDERLQTLEEQLRSYHVSSPFQHHSSMRMYGGRSNESLAFSSSLNVIEPVTELIREQTHLKSELGLEDTSLGPGGDCGESVASDSSACSSSLHRQDKLFDKQKFYSSPRKTVFRASVALTPSPPNRACDNEKPMNTESLEVSERSNPEHTERQDQIPFTSPANESAKWTPEESRELQQVIREIKESIVGDIRREIVSGLLAAVSSPLRSLDGKTDGRI
ncbi:hypothetical protein GDO86_016960 [Hymenochirus boettgeri]|uniref:ITPR-interacting domain-containing protein n=1 Tax=Hymenochirus boettgeri TaxID=247094 RepID=A0A8T2IPS5_9PIPI|nr:hypothetical protein GDO86_016960 [Hymenochirus boettgeri]